MRFSYLCDYLRNWFFHLIQEVFYWNCFAKIKIALNDQNDTQAFVGVSLELQHFLARKETGLFLQGCFFPLIRSNRIKRQSRGEKCGVRISLGCILRTGGRSFPHWRSSQAHTLGEVCSASLISCQPAAGTPGSAGKAQGWGIGLQGLLPAWEQAPRCVDTF